MGLFSNPSGPLFVILIKKYQAYGMDLGLVWSGVEAAPISLEQGCYRTA
ncbi:protein of unknown function [Pseudodesulfovibrio piezophilus C1TLV30]|uniref:Uncharacterized protein n=1 Tax=Pseudodesulfovibrio piezophilus (strain DSM 21447 / JCM 15486 / C1TLV30) TaxID=1322246 RepID=M1WTN8_PSEP2|nr:protein of unknown function [Pseudodesulfovibrio piezophilus C1TLV30]